MSDILERAGVPKDAKIAFEGMRCRVYQWPQQLYDGTMATYEKTMRLPASTVIAVVEGKIVVQEQEQPNIKMSFLSLPGGHADAWDEPLEDIAKRELLEETGLATLDWQLFADLTQVHFHIFEHHIYLARGCVKAAEPKLDRGEKITAKLVTVEEFKDIIQDPRWRHADFAAYLNKPGNFDRLEKLIKN